MPLVEAQTHRRFLKTHLPVDALVFSEKAKYIYIGRDGRDVVWSLYNHHANAPAGREHRPGAETEGQHGVEIRILSPIPLLRNFPQPVS